MKQALHIKNLTKKYKDFTLDHISLDLPAYRGYANGRLIFLKIFLYADYCFCVSAFRLLLY